MADRPLRYRDFLPCARRFGVRELEGRGKGSERLWERVVEGRRYVATVTCHGEGKELRVGLMRAVRRRLMLDRAHGIQDDDFYD